jgi:hypothetical protein
MSDETDPLIRRLNRELLVLDAEASEAANLSVEWLLCLARQADNYLKQKPDYVCLVLIQMRYGGSGDSHGGALDARIEAYSRALQGELQRRHLSL